MVCLQRWLLEGWSPWVIMKQWKRALWNWMESHTTRGGKCGSEHTWWTEVAGRGLSVVLGFFLYISAAGCSFLYAHCNPWDQNHISAHMKFSVIKLLICQLLWTNSVSIRAELRMYQFSPVQSLSRVRLFETPWIAARQASLSILARKALPWLKSLTLASVLLYCIRQK